MFEKRQIFGRTNMENFLFNEVISEKATYCTIWWNRLYRPANFLRRIYRNQNPSFPPIWSWVSLWFCRRARCPGWAARSDHLKFRVYWFEGYCAFYSNFCIFRDNFCKKLLRSQSETSVENDECRKWKKISLILNSFLIGCRNNFVRKLSRKRRNLVNKHNILSITNYAKHHVTQYKK